MGELGPVLRGGPSGAGTDARGPTRQLRPGELGPALRGVASGAGTDARGPKRQLEHHLDLLGKEQVVFLVDFTGFGWKNMDAKSAIQLLKQAQDHAPERLKKLVAYDPPVLFWTLWRVSARGEMRRPPGAARRD